MTKKSDLLGGSAAFDTFVSAPPVSDRGLAIAAMTGDVVPTATPATPKAQVDQIAHNPYNPRLTLKAIQNMADSIEQVPQGLITPIAVVTREAFLEVHPETEKELGNVQFVAIDGNRRLAGARMAGLEELPIHVDNELARDADELLKAALIADAQHEDLDHLDQARALARLVEAHGSQRAVARVLGKSQGWVSQRLSLLNLSEELQQQLADGELTVEVARKIAKFPAEQQKSALAAELASKPTEPVEANIVAPRQERETPPTPSQSQTKPAAPQPPAASSEQPDSDYGVITPSTAPAAPASPKEQSDTEAAVLTGAPSQVLDEAEAGEDHQDAKSDYGVITPVAPAAQWLAWLATATTSTVADTLIDALDQEHLYELVHALADHLRATEE